MTRFVPRTTAGLTAASHRGRRFVAGDRRACRQMLAEDRLDRTMVEYLELARLEVETGPGLRVGSDTGRSGRKDADHRQQAALDGGRLARGDHHLCLRRAERQDGDEAAEHLVADAAV